MTVITRVFDDYDMARTAKDRVEMLGLPDVEVSILGNENLRKNYGSDIGRAGDQEASGTSTGSGIGATIGGGAGLLAGLGMLAIPGVGPLVAAGWLAATAVGVAGGAVAGGAVGALVDLGLSHEEGPIFSEAIRRGGVAVSVRFMERDRAPVEAALDQHGAMPLADRRAAYEADGWSMDETEASRDRRLAGMPPLGL